MEKGTEILLGEMRSNKNGGGGMLWLLILSIILGGISLFLFLEMKENKKKSNLQRDEKGYKPRTINTINKY